MIFKGFKNFALLFHKASEKGLLLMLAAFAAIVIANSSIGSYYDILFNGHIKVILNESRFEFTLHNFVNDFLMAFFFLMVGIEIKRELISGHLCTTKARILPVTAAIAGVIAPAIIYTLFNFKDEIGMRGWAIPTATDIAFALAVYSIFARNLPTSLRVFLTALAIIDDLIAVLIIALFYSSGISVTYLLGIVIVSLVIYNLNGRKYGNISAYFALGALLWLMFAESGIHATVAGVLLGFLLPIVDTKKKNPSARMEKMIHPFVQYLILPIFAFVNSGVIIDSFNSDILFNNVSLGIILGLVIGKQFGIFSITWAIIKLGFSSLPTGSNFKQFYAVSIICGIGFTMSLFIGDLAFAAHSDYINHVKVGVLVGSFISVILGALVLRFFK